MKNNSIAGERIFEENGRSFHTGEQESSLQLPFFSNFKII